MISPVAGEALGEEVLAMNGSNKKTTKESSRIFSERLALDIYEQHTEYLKIVEKFNIRDKAHVAELAALHKSIIDLAVILARAVLDAKTDEERVKSKKRA